MNLYEILILVLVGLYFYLIFFHKKFRQKIISRPIDYVDILTELAELKTMYSSLEKKVCEQEEELFKMRESIVFYEEKHLENSDKNIFKQIDLNKTDKQPEKKKRKNSKQKE